MRIVVEPKAKDSETASQNHVDAHDNPRRMYSTVSMSLEHVTYMQAKRGRDQRNELIESSKQTAVSEETLNVAEIIRVGVVRISP